MRLEHLHEHYLQPFVERATDFRKLKKGRKRVNCTRSANMWEFVHGELIPGWTQALAKISQKQRELRISQKKYKYLWTEFLKDVRNFYRVMFRLRFHRSDKRVDMNSSAMVEYVLNEIGICHKGYPHLEELFSFFYKIRFSHRKQMEDDVFDTDIVHPNFVVFKEFTETNKNLFLNDYFGARLTYFFVANFGDLYLAEMSGQFRDQAAQIIEMLKDKYESEPIED